VTTRLLLFAVVTVLPLWAQGGRGGAQNRQAAVTPVPFERILRANQEPQNWLTYSGNLSSQRHSLLTQISPANARDLTLKWVFQSRSLEKHELTPLVVVTDDADCVTSAKRIVRRGDWNDARPVDGIGPARVV